MLTYTWSLFVASPAWQQCCCICGVKHPSCILHPPPCPTLLHRATRAWRSSWPPCRAASSSGTAGARLRWLWRGGGATPPLRSCCWKPGRGPNMPASVRRRLPALAAAARFKRRRSTAHGRQRSGAATGRAVRAGEAAEAAEGAAHHRGYVLAEQATGEAAVEAAAQATAAGVSAAVEGRVAAARLSIGCLCSSMTSSPHSRHPRNAAPGDCLDVVNATYTLRWFIQQQGAGQV